MHHSSRPWRDKMTSLTNALNLGKSGILINSLWEKNNHTHDSTLKALDKIQVREVMSRDDLLLNHNVDSVVCPDLSLQAKIDINESYKDLKGRRLVTDFFSSEFKSFVKITGGPLAKSNYIDMSKVNWSQLVNTMKTSSLVVTGRHHAVMAACKAHVPFVALKGNSHKIEGFLKTSGFPIPVCEHPHQIQNAMRWAERNSGVFSELFSWVDDLPRWSLL